MYTHIHYIDSIHYITTQSCIHDHACQYTCKWYHITLHLQSAGKVVELVSLNDHILSTFHRRIDDVNLPCRSQKKVNTVNPSRLQRFKLHGEASPKSSLKHEGNPQVVGFPGCFRDTSASTQAQPGLRGPVTGSFFCFCIWVLTKSKGKEKKDAKKPA